MKTMVFGTRSGQQRCPRNVVSLSLDRAGCRIQAVMRGMGRSGPTQGHVRIHGVVDHRTTCAASTGLAATMHPPHGVHAWIAIEGIFDNFVPIPGEHPLDT